MCEIRRTIWVHLKFNKRKVPLNRVRLSSIEGRNFGFFFRKNVIFLPMRIALKNSLESYWRKHVEHGSNIIFETIRALLKFENSEISEFRKKFDFYPTIFFLHTQKCANFTQELSFFLFSNGIVIFFSLRKEKRNHTFYKT